MMMVRWWAVFFIAGVFAPCNPVSTFIPILIIVIDQWRDKSLVDLLFFPSTIRESGDQRLQAVRIRDFILISSTGIIVMSAAGSTFIVSDFENRDFKTEKCLKTSLSAYEHGSYVMNPIRLSGNIAGRSISGLRAHFQRRINSPGIDHKTGQILRALLLAERDGIDDGLYEKFRFLGIAHFLALSGLHLGIIAVSVSLILNLICPQRGAREIILFCSLIIYMAVVRYPHSLLRAVSLYAFFRMFRYFGIRSSLEDALIAGSLLLVSINPALLFSKGYQLSFLAVSAISLIAIPFTDRLGRYMPSIKKRKYAGFLISAVTVTVSIQIFTMPVILEYFGRVPLISPAANLLFILPISAILHLGLIHLILPLAVTGYTTAPLLRHISHLLYSMPAFLLKPPQYAILKGQIENTSYCAGLLFLIFFLGKGCRKRKTVLISSLLCFLFSFTAGVLNGRSNQRLMNPDSSWNYTFGKKGITHHIGESRIVVIDRGVSFSTMEKYIRSLWGDGVSKVDVIIITSGTLNGKRGLSLLINRMKPERVYCSPFIEEGISELIGSEVSWKTRIVPVDSTVTLSGRSMKITILPPGQRLRPGVRTDAGSSGIEYLIEYQNIPYDNN
ncbi:MAG: ComEC/Rec2 family competence protein [Candidatus Krumholzibacteriota bacterium]|nr:ComEC/Rec2 family competence protein [Candidatus Krumholzibacteriota bacterium]